MTRLPDVLFPAARGASPLELCAILLLGSVAAFFRLGDAALRGNLWAEDGGVFLQTALLHTGIASVFESYGGYMNLTPMVLAKLVALLPIASQGMALNLAAAVVQAAVAALAYTATSGYIAGRWWRALLAVTVVAVPVGPEVINSIANLQWFLLFGGCLCLLWTPRKPLGWGVLFLVLVVTALSSPFAVILLIGAFCRVAIQRSGAAKALFGVVAAGFVLQSVVMWQAPARTGERELGVDLDPRRLVAGFVWRVIGDGFLGPPELQIYESARGFQAGVGVLALLAVLVFWLSTHDGFPVLFRAGLLGALALVTYSLPVGVTPSLSTFSPVSSGRYYVAPALLVIVATLSMIAAVTDRGGGPPGRVRWLALASCGALVLSLFWGVGSSWDAGKVLGRQRGPAWQPGISQAREACADSLLLTDAFVLLSPKGWAMTVPCDLLER